MIPLRRFDGTLPLLSFKLYNAVHVAHSGGNNM